MTSWGDEDLRCFARMQCDPNSSAMLTRSIIKQVKPRLESPAAEDWGISARCKSSTKPLQAPLELTGLKAVTHTAPALPQAPTFFITKKYVLWTISLPLGWICSTWQLELGLKQCHIWVKLRYGADLCGFGCLVYLPWGENYRHDPSF